MSLGLSFGRPPTCATGIPNVAAFCKSNGANGLIASPSSVMCTNSCDQYHWDSKGNILSDGRGDSLCAIFRGCDKNHDAHKCCRAPSSCTLRLGMGKIDIGDFTHFPGNTYAMYTSARAHFEGGGSQNGLTGSSSHSTSTSKGVPSLNIPPASHQRANSTFVYNVGIPPVDKAQ